MDTSPKVLEIPKDEVVMEDDETIVPEKKYSQSMLNYMTLLAIMQGFAALINLNVVFMLAGMVPKALNVHPFSTTVVFIFEGVACVVNTIIFWTNPLKPWLTVSICYVQAAAHVFQIIVASLVNSSVGKYMYLFGTAVCGAAFGCNCMTSFALVAFAPVNKLGAFSFGCALGGVVPFLFSTAVQFTFFADETVASTKGMMCSMMTFVIILSVACAINLTIYLNNEDIKRHYAQVHSDGITSVKCTLRAAARGMKYTWKIVVIQFISYINILTFYPSILPLSMWVEFSYRIVLIGVFQFCDTLGRAIGVFVDPKGCHATPSTGSSSLPPAIWVPPPSWSARPYSTRHSLESSASSSLASSYSRRLEAIATHMRTSQSVNMSPNTLTRKLLSQLPAFSPLSSQSSVLLVV